MGTMNLFEAAARRIAPQAFEDGATADEQSADRKAVETSAPPAGKLVRPAPRKPDGSLKLEQNLGCELPVCVANRRDVNELAIEFETEKGLAWSLARAANRKLPAPEHYPYWLWFLDRCQAAAEAGSDAPPRIILDPPQLFDLFGGPRGGRRYEQLDEAFERFSSLLIQTRTVFYDRGREYETKANLGTLCYYASWRVKPGRQQEVLEFAKGWVAPGPLLWSSVQAGYLKSVPLTPLRDLDYVGQRLYTYLSKHCRKGGEFSISPVKLLPKIPMRCPPDQLKRKLGSHHEALAKVGFLADVQIEGRGKSKLITYRRA